MARYCRGGKGRNTGSKILGIALMAVGTLILLLFVPCWVWTGILAVLLISAGFLIWRFN